MIVLKALLPYFQIIISILLIITILLQQRGAALGESFGNAGSAYYTKRGIEKMLFITTIILSFLFVLSNLISLVI